MKKKFNKILITGGAGYVGIPLVRLLLSKGYSVRILDNLVFGGVGLIPFISNPRFEIIKDDIRGKGVLEKALDGVNAVVHLCAIVGFPACRKEPKLSREINVTATKKLVDLCAKKIPIIFASTGSNYGKMLEDICTETSKLNPLSEYGHQKTKGESIVKGNENFVIYRFATAFGVSPRMRLDLLINDFVYKAVVEKSVIVYEKHFLRTFIHVEDMARSFLFALEHFDKMNGEVYNVGDETMNFSKEDVCLMIKENISFYLHFAEIGKDLDQRNYLVSYEKIKKVGFRTKINLKQGIKELIKVMPLIQIPKNFSNV